MTLFILSYIPYRLVLYDAVLPLLPPHGPTQPLPKSKEQRPGEWHCRQHTGDFLLRLLNLPWPQCKEEASLAQGVHEKNLQVSVSCRQQQYLDQVSWRVSSIVVFAAGVAFRYWQQQTLQWMAFISYLFSLEKHCLQGKQIKCFQRLYEFLNLDKSKLFIIDNTFQTRSNCKNIKGINSDHQIFHHHCCSSNTDMFLP